MLYSSLKHFKKPTSLAPVLLCFLLSLPLSAAFSVDSPVKKNNEEKDIDLSTLVLHHIADAHEFHIIKDIALPLPVILWAKKGLIAFMSHEFNHDDEGKTIVTKKGIRLIKYHGKIYYAAENGHLLLDQDEQPLNDKPIDLSITKNVFSMLLSVLIICWLFIRSAKNYTANGLPKGLCRFTEPLVVFVRNEIAIPSIGEKKHARYLPYLLTIFFFIWINNIMGLIPFFPFSANLSGNISFTLSLAILTFIITTISGNRNYWLHIFWMPGVPKAMRLLLFPIEFIGVFTKPITLFIRLFANITAGHIVVLTLTGLIFVFKNLYGTIGAYGIAPVAIIFSTFISLIEILVVAIQAYIFTMLSAIYFGMATSEEKH